MHGPANPSTRATQSSPVPGSVQTETGVAPASVIGRGFGKQRRSAGGSIETSIASTAVSSVLHAARSWCGKSPVALHAGPEAGVADRLVAAAATARARAGVEEAHPCGRRGRTGGWRLPGHADRDERPAVPALGHGRQSRSRSSRRLCVSESFDTDGGCESRRSPAQRGRSRPHADASRDDTTSSPRPGNREPVSSGPWRRNAITARRGPPGSRPRSSCSHCSSRRGAAAHRHRWARMHPRGSSRPVGRSPCSITCSAKARRIRWAAPRTTRVRTRIADELARLGLEAEVRSAYVCRGIACAPVVDLIAGSPGARRARRAARRPLRLGARGARCRRRHPRCRRVARGRTRARGGDARTPGRSCCSTRARRSACSAQRRSSANVRASGRSRRRSTSKRAARRAHLAVRDQRKQRRARLALGHRRSGSRGRLAGGRGLPADAERHRLHRAAAGRDRRHQPRIHRWRRALPHAARRCRASRSRQRPAPGRHRARSRPVHSRRGPPPGVPRRCSRSPTCSASSWCAGRSSWSLPFALVLRARARPRDRRVRATRERAHRGRRGSACSPLSRSGSRRRSPASGSSRWSRRARVGHPAALAHPLPLRMATWATLTVVDDGARATR